MPSSHAPVVFHTNPCNFTSFQAAIKSFPFGVRAQKFPLFLIFYSSFYLPIVICQQLLLVVINNRKISGGQSFLASIQNLLIFAIFKSSLNFNLIRHWSKNWCSGYLKHALSSSEIHFAVAKSLEIIRHMTNCCKRPIACTEWKLQS